MKPIRAERDYELWIFNSIKHYFGVLGFKYHGFSISQKLEHRIPADIFVWIENGNHIKLLGLQIKAPYVDTRKKFHYKFDLGQLKTIMNLNKKLGSPWIYYVLPRYYEPIFDNMAIVHSSIAPPDILYRNSRKHATGKKEVTLSLEDIRQLISWGRLIRNILRCKTGLEITREKIEEVIKIVPYETVLLFMNFTTERIALGKIITVEKSPT